MEEERKLMYMSIAKITPGGPEGPVPSSSAPEGAVPGVDRIDARELHIRPEFLHSGVIAT